MTKPPIELAEHSHNPMHQLATDQLKAATEYALEHPEMNRAFIVLAEYKVIPGELDDLEVMRFNAGFNDLELVGLMTTLAGSDVGR